LSQAKLNRAGGIADSIGSLHVVQKVCGAQ
jgi:hypothetical protein